jgi:hypothetical protein
MSASQTILTSLAFQYPLRSDEVSAAFLDTLGADEHPAKPENAKKNKRKSNFFTSNS